MLWDFDVEGAVAVANRRASDRLLGVVHDSLKVANHADLLSWLQGDFQGFLPHEILLVAWGDPSLDSFHIDVTSSLQDVRTQAVGGTAIPGFVRMLFDRWTAGGHAPCHLPVPEGAVREPCDAYERGFAAMRHALVHGIRNQRDDQLCLYVLLRASAFPASWERNLRVLLPYMDAALRQVEHLPTQRGNAPSAAPERTGVPHLEGLALSEREADIVRWVAAGKTNQEIGMIMGISQFTVKNHLRRIFQKLDVSNRAQAVEKILRHGRLHEAPIRRQG